MTKLILSWLTAALATNVAAGAGGPLKVLTYSSMLDKGGMGEWIKTQDKDIQYIASKDFSGILGQLRRLQRQHSLSSVDVVLGLNETNYRTALSEKLIEPGVPFERGSFTILVNRSLLPEAQWPKSWSALAKDFKKKLLIQDPRTSEVGLAWLLNATYLKNLSLAEARALPLKSFPKWSSAFAAFENGMAPLMWTYASSVAYFACNRIAKPYANLSLPGYPEDTNYVAIVRGNAGNPHAAQFVSFMHSDPAQSQLWQKNWMFPVANLHPPACYVEAQPKLPTRKLGVEHSGDIIKWLDEWSL